MNPSLWLRLNLVNFLLLLNGSPTPAACGVRALGG
jgi:hypothetical protein